MGQAKTQKVKNWFNGLSAENQEIIKNAPSPKRIARRVIAAYKKGRFNMAYWVNHDQHGCTTAMCLSGWAMHMAGLESRVNVGDIGQFFFPDGTLVASEEAGSYLLSLGVDDDGKPESDIFYATERKALDFIKKRWNL